MEVDKSIPTRVELYVSAEQSSKDSTHASQGMGVSLQRSTLLRRLPAFCRREAVGGRRGRRAPKEALTTLLAS